ncbi:MAG: hypothetical protein IJD92_04810 [Bacilli bacterium]|nr:hypothetical protein [Bacilli bacterium]
MDENLELLTYLYQDADMALNNLTLLINKINKKDNKIKKIIEGEIKGYENYLKKVKEYIKENNYDVKSKPLISKVGAYFGINMEVMKDNSDSRIADMLIQGFTMGVLSVSKKIDSFKGDANKEVLKLAEEFKKFQQENIEFLKSFL